MCQMRSIFGLQWKNYSSCNYVVLVVQVLKHANIPYSYCFYLSYSSIICHSTISARKWFSWLVHFKCNLTKPNQNVPESLPMLIRPTEHLILLKWAVVFRNRLTCDRDELDICSFTHIWLKLVLVCRNYLINDTWYVTLPYIRYEFEYESGISSSDEISLHRNRIHF